MPPLRLVDVRTIGAPQLDPLLAEEATEWRTELDWDFAPVAALIRRLATERKLAGAALMDGGELAGCGYVTAREQKGLIVDAWVRARWRDEAAELCLFRALFGSLIGTPEVRRVEAQLMLLAPPDRPMPGIQIQIFDRVLMRRSVSEPFPIGRKPCGGYRIERWNNWHKQGAAAVLTASRKGHVDASLSDFYRSASGAASLIENIIEPQIAGTFCASASFLATDAATARAAGFVLAGFTAAETGHISEISLAPEVQGRGLGRELLRLSLEALRDRGAERVSLSVTAANERAFAFYRKCGFREFHRYPAYAWEREPAISPTSESRNTAALCPSLDF